MSLLTKNRIRRDKLTSSCQYRHKLELHVDQQRTVSVYRTDVSEHCLKCAVKQEARLESHPILFISNFTESFMNPIHIS